MRTQEKVKEPSPHQAQWLVLMDEFSNSTGLLFIFKKFSLRGGLIHIWCYSKQLLQQGSPSIHDLFRFTQVARVDPGQAYVWKI